LELFERRRHSNKEQWIERGDMFPRVTSEEPSKHNSHSHDHHVADPDEGCDYVDMSAPSNAYTDMQMVMETVWEIIQESLDNDSGNETSLGLLEIAHANEKHRKKRLGNTCENTTPEWMTGYFNCSFQDVTRDITLLLATSIRNTEIDSYDDRVAYKAAMDSVVPSNVHLIDLNRIVFELLPQKAKISSSVKYYEELYPPVVVLDRIVSLIRQHPRIEVHLVQRGKGACEECTPVKDQLEEF
jgi:hypothetical protein